MLIVCLDFEGILIPEIWIHVAEQTGIEALRVTTRDVSDYEALMSQRLSILDEHQIILSHIQKIILEMGPIEGALDFLAWLQKRFQVVLVSDTFYEFAAPFLSQFGYPLLFCHHLKVTKEGRLTGITIRQDDSKRKAVRAFQKLQYKVIAVGDSYNDTSMLTEADTGILFRPPEIVINDFPQFAIATNYAELRQSISESSSRLKKLQIIE